MLALGGGAISLEIMHRQQKTGQLRSTRTTRRGMDPEDEVAAWAVLGVVQVLAGRGARASPAARLDPGVLHERMSHPLNHKAKSTVVLDASTVSTTVMHCPAVDATH